MKQAAFEARYQDEIERFEKWLELGKRKWRRNDSGDDTALRTGDVPAAYRHICQLMALARDRQYSPELVDRLNHLVLRGHHVLYGPAGGQRARLMTFLASGFPTVVRAERSLVLTSALLFFGPLLLLLASLQFHPDFVLYFVSPGQLSQYEEMYKPENARLGQRDSDDNIMMFAFYIWHNVKIGIQTFATGLAFGLGSIFYLVFNGAIIGAIAGYLTSAGLGGTFWPFVAGHSAMELSAIVLSGAAGLKLGFALVAPGTRSRKAALIEAARPAIRIMYGAALMFMLAAFIEGFWSPFKLVSPQIKYAAGSALWIAVLGYFTFGGRRRGA
ncbi:MAG: stage II sporulation protein M [Burkholderiales bacterium]